MHCRAGACPRRYLPGYPRERAAFLKVASLDFYRKRPRRLRRGGRPHFFPKKWGERRAGGLPAFSKRRLRIDLHRRRPRRLRPQPPQYGGPWRRWAVRTGQRPSVHCRPLRRHKLRIARFAASGKARSLHCASSPHRTRFAGLRRGPRNDHLSRRCRAPGGTHRGYPASPESCCAVPAWPAGPPLVPCLRNTKAFAAAGKRRVRDAAPYASRVMATA